MIGHLNKDKLFVEADAWLEKLEVAAEDVAKARLDVKEHTEKIEAQEEKTEALEEKTEALIKTLAQHKKNQDTNEVAIIQLNTIITEARKYLTK